jgi:hypothetical protein
MAEKDALRITPGTVPGTVPNVVQVAVRTEVWAAIPQRVAGLKAIGAAAAIVSLDLVGTCGPTCMAVWALT